MCGVGFSLSGKEAAVVAVGAFVLSPLILVGAVGWFTVKGLAAGVRVLKNHNGKRLRDGARQLMKGIRHQLGRDQLAKAIAELDVRIQATQDTELYFQRASVKFLDLQLNSALLDLDTYLAANPNAVAPLMLKGKILSFYDRFDEADAVFNLAAAEADPDTIMNEANLPTNFNKADALMSIAANRLRQIGKTDNFISNETVKLINEAEQALNMVDAAEVSKDAETLQRWNWMMGACKFYTFCQEQHGPDEFAAPSIQAAIRHLVQALTSGDNAELQSFLSQCYRLAGDPNADTLLNAARQSDPNVFVADITDRHAMLVPWPVRNILPDGAEVRDQHEFKEKSFHKPTSCDVCNKFVHGSWFRSDRECSHCGMRVHSQCEPNVRGKCVASKE